MENLDRILHHSRIFKLNDDIVDRIHKSKVINRLAKSLAKKYDSKVHNYYIERTVESLLKYNQPPYAGFRTETQEDDIVTLTYNTVTRGYDRDKDSLYGLIVSCNPEIHDYTFDTYIKLNKELIKIIKKVLKKHIPDINILNCCVFSNDHIIVRIKLK